MRTTADWAFGPIRTKPRLSWRTLMMSAALSRLTLASTITAFFLAGCAHQPAARPVSSTTTVSSSSTTTAVAGSSRTSTATHVAHRSPVTGSTSAAASDAGLPDHTGVAACDDYLSSYLACHRAAHIFAPDQLQSRYQAMRTSLLRDSQDPDIRPQLAARCNSLAGQLRDALHGKSCDSDAAPASTSP